ncbi:MULTISPECIES: DJ-1/PfpI family protein [unclassified Brevibacterium]|uniref:DJ-1/PfpI family protein n=1 Tax=unclassified Brevibacterium TaxID=2614124 RepID=UPI001091D899|nr:DJ-1/PfpI family protein [Brevibacterium sp. S22]TGD30122.1 DJ-1/PfpI family protein [Brevibacterium sp. S22]
MDSRTRSVAVVLFDGFEVLDVFGPVELFSRLPDSFALSCVATHPGRVRSAQGIEVIASESFDTASTPDIVLVPGGMGTRQLVDDRSFLDSLVNWSADADLITSVCTGSAVLAAAGLLDGYRATSNKKAFTWASELGEAVTWVPQARWVEDRDRWTSSGVAAGMDMTAALIAHLHGAEAAATAARDIELDIHTDSDWDPFAAHHGLV